MIKAKEYLEFKKEDIIENLRSLYDEKETQEIFNNLATKLTEITEYRHSKTKTEKIIEKLMHLMLERNYSIAHWLIKVVENDDSYCYAYNYLAQYYNRNDLTLFEYQIKHISDPELFELLKKEQSNNEEQNVNEEYNNIEISSIRSSNNIELNTDSNNNEKAKKKEYKRNNLDPHLQECMLKKIELNELLDSQNFLIPKVPINEVYEHFKTLTILTNKSNEFYLTNEQLILFIKATFIDKKPIKQELNCKSYIKKDFRRVFYEFYSNCKNKERNLTKIKRKYFNILYDAFEGFNENDYKDFHKT